ncbi:RAMP superfamily CRISPR-associated protein, partial [Desulfobacterales bacterium HSG17]|nr:RAMP superfamily CRISPR-associated protein [Desulfobacterales bacterium HSG17]
MHYMNPFDFVPLSAAGPKQIPDDVLNDIRVEGYITYSLKTLTPLHINGKTTKSGSHFDKKYFYESYGHKLIPGASIRGMLYSYIEALTGSDLSIYTRGDEEGSSKIPAYGKHFDPRNAQKCRHVGFLMTSKDDNLKAKDKSVTYNHRGKSKTRKVFEQNETLANKFGLHKVNDVARFLFGYVDEDKKENTDKNTLYTESARAGRLIFEDVLLADNTKM